MYCPLIRMLKDSFLAYTSRLWSDTRVEMTFSQCYEMQSVFRERLYRWQVTANKTNNRSTTRICTERHLDVEEA